MCGPSKSELQTELDQAFDRDQKANSLRVTDISTVFAHAMADGVDQAQICRTCPHQSDRLFHVTNKAKVMLAARRAGTILSFSAKVTQDGKLRSDLDPIQRVLAEAVMDPPNDIRTVLEAVIAKYSCAPTDHISTKKVLADRRVLDLSEQTNISTTAPRRRPDGSVEVSLTRKPTQRIASLVDTCGHQALPKCQKCAHFAPFTVPVQGGINDNNRAWFTNVVVGGFCRRDDGCHPAPKPVDTTARKASCYSCGNLQVFGDNWQHAHGEVWRVDLTAFEMELARRNATTDDEGRPQIGRAINAARRQMGTVMFPKAPGSKIHSPAPIGNLLFFKGTIIDRVERIDSAPLWHLGTAPKSLDLIELGARAADAFRHPQILGYVSRQVDHDGPSIQNQAASAWIMWGQYLRPDEHEAPRRLIYWLAGGQYENPNRERFIAEFVDNHSQRSQATVLEPIKVPPALRIKRSVSHITVRFRGGTVASFETSNGDPVHGVVVSDPSEPEALVMFASPWHRMVGLMESNQRQSKALPKNADCPQHFNHCEVCNVALRAAPGKPKPRVTCNTCAGTGRIHQLPSRGRLAVNMNRIDPECAACHLSFGPCYYHAKGPRRDIDEGGMRVYSLAVPEQKWLNNFRGRHAITKRESARGARAIFNKMLSMERFRSLTWNDDVAAVTNRAGEVPDIWLFKTQLAGLKRRFAAHAEAIDAQFRTAWRALDNGKPYTTDLGFGAPMAVQPWVPYCSANLHNPALGIDMRFAFGDYWGDSRASQSTNPGHRSEVPPAKPGDVYFARLKAASLDEWVRTTNPGERVQEEMLTTLHLFERGKEAHSYAPADIIPAQAEVIHIDPLGVIDGTATTVDKYNDLNSIYVAPCPHHCDHDDPDQHVRRTITKIDPDGDQALNVVVTGRFLEYGYNLGGRTANSAKKQTSSGFSVSRTDLDEVFAMVESTDDPDEIDPNYFVGFLCYSCATRYEPDEAIEREFICDHITEMLDDDEIETCGGAIAWTESAKGSEWRAGNLRTTADQITATEPYRRAGGPTMATAPDTTAWQRDEILESLGHGCPLWRPRAGRVDRYANQRGKATKATRSADEWLGKRVQVTVEGETYVMEITDSTIKSPVIHAFVESNGAGEVSYWGPYQLHTARVAVLN